MNKKLLAHLAVFAGLIIWTWTVWERTAPPEVTDEDYVELDEWGNPWDPNEKVPEDNAAGRMTAVLLPFALTVGYAGFLGVFYLLPALGSGISQGMMGSNTEPVESLSSRARRAARDEDWVEAVALWHQAFAEDSKSREAVAEAARIQKEELESPATAVATLDNGLEKGDWDEDDRAFLLFRKAEILEEKEPEEAKKVYEDVLKAMPESRHAGNARQKLRELG